MRHDFTLGEVERHLQGDKDGELEGYQLPPADPETLLQLLQTRQKPTYETNMSMICVINVLLSLWMLLLDPVFTCFGDVALTADHTAALSRLPAEALCWTGSRTFDKYESFTPKHVNVGPSLKMQEFPFTLCTTCSIYILRWLTIKLSV